MAVVLSGLGACSSGSGPTTAVVMGCGGSNGSDAGGDASSGGSGGTGGTGGGVTGGTSGAPAERVLEYVRSDTFSRLVVEVDAVTGFEHRPGVASDLVEGMTPLLDKPDGIEVVSDGELPARGDEPWTFDDLDALAQQHLDLEVTEDTAKIHVMFVDGSMQSDTGATLVGLAWAHRHIAIFKETLESSCSAGLPTGSLEAFCAAGELSVWTHEVGHVLGLVDNGTPMVTEHKDEEHGAHDDNQDCVMYFAYDGTGLFDQLSNRFLNGNNDALGFDQACRDDLAALRE